MFGEMFGEVFGKHLTIRTPLQQRLFAHFGEVLGRKQEKNTEAGLMAPASVQS